MPHPVPFTPEPASAPQSPSFQSPWKLKLANRAREISVKRTQRPPTVSTHAMPLPLLGGGQGSLTQPPAPLSGGNHLTTSTQPSPPSKGASGASHLSIPSAWARAALASPVCGPGLASLVLDAVTHHFILPLLPKAGKKETWAPVSILLSRTAWEKEATGLEP